MLLFHIHHLFLFSIDHMLLFRIDHMLLLTFMSCMMYILMYSTMLLTINLMFQLFKIKDIAFCIFIINCWMLTFIVFPIKLSKWNSNP